MVVSTKYLGMVLRNEDGSIEHAMFKNGGRIKPLRSRKIVDYAPDFEWGVDGPRALQASLALLKEEFQDSGYALAWHIRFKDRVILELLVDQDWQMTGREIQDTILDLISEIGNG